MKHKLSKLLSVVKWLLPFTAIIILVACNGAGSGSSTSSDPVTPVVPPNSANISVTVSPNYGISGGVCSNVNAPCVSVTICEPNAPTACVTVNDVLLDSGSYGLRVFGSLLGSVGSGLPVETSGGESIAECVNYADEAANWGPVVLAKIVLGSESTTQSIPMQIIDASFATLPDACSVAVNDATPSQFGFNGVLGVGPLITAGSKYYKCNSHSVCTEYTSISTVQQVSNPIAFLRYGYNNGVTFNFPSVGDNGGIDVTGYTIFGVGTESDNTPSESENKFYSISIYSHGIPIRMPTASADSQLASVSYGFLDTGSNGLFFTTDEISTYGPWYSPSSTLVLTAINTDSAGAGVPVDLNIANAEDLFNSTSNNAFNNLGGTLGITMTQYLNYGFPFFLGKTVYMCFDGNTCAGRSGPYWAF